MCVTSSGQFVCVFESLAWLVAFWDGYQIRCVLRPPQWDGENYYIVADKCRVINGENSAYQIESAN